MIIKPVNLIWTKFTFQNREGWMNTGGPQFEIPEKPRKFWDMVANICTRTEGGAYAAYNGYDMAIASLGLLQFAGAVGGSPLMKLLKAFYDKDKELLVQLLMPGLNISKATLKVINNDLFFFTDKPVTTQSDWCNLINGGASGLIGSWDDKTKNISKIWAQAFIDTASHPKFIEVQKEFYMNNIKNNYFLKANLQIIDKFTGEKVLVKPSEILQYSENTESMDVYQKACIAIFISYCANLPLYAIQNLYYTIGKNKNLSWRNKFIMFATKCGVESTIKEWPIRWKHISPILQDDLGIDISLQNDDEITDKFIPIPITIDLETKNTNDDITLSNKYNFLDIIINFIKKLFNLF